MWPAWQERTEGLVSALLLLVSEVARPVKEVCYVLVAGAFPSSSGSAGHIEEACLEHQVRPVRPAPQEQAEDLVSRLLPSVSEVAGHREEACKGVVSELLPSVSEPSGRIEEDCLEPPRLDL